MQHILKAEAKKSLFAGADKLKLTSEAWKSLRYNFMVKVEKLLTVSMREQGMNQSFPLVNTHFFYRLQRPIEPYEREMFLYPRVCATCYSDEGSSLKECSQCESVFFCSDEHCPSNHSEHCKDLKLLLDLNVEQSKKGRIECMLPHELLKKFEEFPLSLKVRR